MQTDLIYSFAYPTNIQIFCKTKWQGCNIYVESSAYFSAQFQTNAEIMITFFSFLFLFIYFYSFRPL